MTHRISIKTVPVLFSVFTIASGIILVPSVSFAHPIGLSFNQVVGPYLIDIGYNPPIAQVGSQIGFDFKLWGASATTTPVTFTDVLFTIKQGDNVLFQTDIASPTYGNTNMVYVPPLAGPITIDAQYNNGSTTLAEGTYPLTVAPSGQTFGSGLLPLILAGIVGLIIGVIFTLVVRRSYSDDES